MKKLLFVAAFAIGFTGCQKNENGKDIDESWTKHDFFNRTKIVEIEGHEYIILNGYNGGGITHAESCKCKHR